MDEWGKIGQVRLFHRGPACFCHAGDRARGFARPNSDSTTRHDREGRAGRVGGSKRTWRSTTSTRRVDLLAPRSWRHSAPGPSHREPPPDARDSISAPRAMHAAIAPRTVVRPEVLHASRAARAASHDIGHGGRWCVVGVKLMRLTRIVRWRLRNHNQIAHSTTPIFPVNKTRCHSNCPYKH